MTRREYIFKGNNYNIFISAILLCSVHESIFKCKVEGALVILVCKTPVIFSIHARINLVTFYISSGQFKL